MNDENFKMVEEAASRLAEHHESVRIFVTLHGDEEVSNTESFSTGRGNIHAQIGQVKEWIIRQDEYVRTQARKEQEDGHE